MDHRLAQIVDALIEMLNTLKQDTSVSGFPIKAYLVDKRYIHWTALEIQAKRARQPAFPALLLNFGGDGRRIRGGESAEFASQGQTEDHQPFRLLALLKETPDTPDPISDQVSNIIYSVERLVNGSHDLGVEGVVRTRVEDIPETSEGRASAVAGTPFEIVAFKIVVTHVYSAFRFE